MGVINFEKRIKFEWNDVQMIFGVFYIIVNIIIIIIVINK